jgi:hypothetical protein
VMPGSIVIIGIFVRLFLVIVRHAC